MANIKHLPTSSHSHIRDFIWNKDLITLLKVSRQINSIWGTINFRGTVPQLKKAYLKEVLSRQKYPTSKNMISTGYMKLHIRTDITHVNFLNPNILFHTLQIPCHVFSRTAWNWWKILDLKSSISISQGAPALWISGSNSSCAIVSIFLKTYICIFFLVPWL